MERMERMILIFWKNEEGYAVKTQNTGLFFIGLLQFAQESFVKLGFI
jgi:hypothetical protein